MWKREGILCWLHVPTEWELMATISLSRFSPLSPARLHCSPSFFCRLKKRTIFLTIESFSSVSASAHPSNPKVVVTRERGKNGKLIAALVILSLLTTNCVNQYFVGYFLGSSVRIIWYLVSHCKLNAICSILFHAIIFYFTELVLFGT